MLSARRRLSMTAHRTSWGGGDVCVSQQLLRTSMGSSDLEGLLFKSDIRSEKTQTYYCLDVGGSSGFPFS